MDRDETKFAVHDSIKENKTLLAKSLIDGNSKLLTLEDDDGRTVFHWACSMNNLDLVTYLCKKKSDNVDIDDMVDASGWTPLHIASSLGNIPIFETLMLTIPKPDIDLATTTLGTTPLHLAVSKGHLSLVRDIVEKYGAKVLVKDKRGATAVHRAASIGSIPILQILYDNKSNLNTADKQGWTAMHHALAEGQGDFAVKLVELGADASLVNNDNLEPYQVSVDEKVARFFKAHVLPETVKVLEK